MKLLITQEWLDRRLAEYGDDLPCEAGDPRLMSDLMAELAAWAKENPPCTVDFAVELLMSLRLKLPEVADEDGSPKNPG